LDIYGSRQNKKDKKTKTNRSWEMGNGHGTNYKSVYLCIHYRLVYIFLPGTHQTQILLPTRSVSLDILDIPYKPGTDPGVRVVALVPVDTELLAKLTD
jgi:hypothetical protein